MRQVLALFVAVVFALSLASVALAQGTQTTPGSPPPAGSSSTDTGKSTTEQPKTGTTGKSGSEMQQKSAAGTKAGAKTAAVRGTHKMMGEVTKIDAAKGMVTVKTDEGDLDLHFPPSALQGMKEGDRVEVQLSIRPAAGMGAKGIAPKGAAPQSGKPAPKSTDTQPKTQ
ncbi:MAG TPA: hypothetical protein VGX21_21795 [Methylomirabilota bacterium]|jgi:cold shock CspA family protein|nr:hypothetical protein [Methylomirabilota bacterium]